MKRITLLLLTVVYFISTSGIAFGSFYCCGKLKETYLFSSPSEKSCHHNSKMPGCCDTKQFFAKVKDNHTPSTKLNLVNNDTGKLLNSLMVSISIFLNPVSEIKLFPFLPDPPLLSDQPVYLSLGNFRI